MKDISFDLAKKGSLIKRVEKIERTLKALQNSSVKANSLDEISDDLGLIKSGAFWATESSGAPTDPEFTGVFMDSAGHVFDDETYQFGGATGGTLQFGGRLSDAALVAGAGNVQLDSDGITILADELSGGLGTSLPIENTYKSFNADGEEIGFLAWGLNDSVDNQGFLYVLGNAGEPNASIIITAKGNGYTLATFELSSSSSGGVTKIGGSGQLLSSSGIIYSGTYTPTLYDTTNVADSTANVCQYLRVGQVVTVSGSVRIDPTTVSILTQLDMTLPISSTLSDIEECAGTLSRSTGSVSGSIFGETTNNRARLNLYPDDAADRLYMFHFTYLIS